MDGEKMTLKKLFNYNKTYSQFICQIMKTLKLIFIFLLAGCTVAFTQQAGNQTSKAFNTKSGIWKKLYLAGSSGGKYKLTPGSLELDTPDGVMYGLYNSSPITGHFYTEVGFKVDDNINLVLFHEKNRKPDLNNYTGMRVEKNNSGVAAVKVFDRQNGIDNVLDNTGKLSKRKGGPFLKNDGYEHELTGKEYSVPYTKTNKLIRIFYDSAAGFFHFYYSVKKIIRGKSAEGWMEIAPSRNWGKPGQKFFAALMGNKKGKSTFKNFRVEKKPAADKDDAKTGFAVTKREYNWSGFFGDALVVSFGDKFELHDKDIKFVFWSEMNYIPAWHINNQLLYTYEFVETWGGGNPGCHEPMSDRLLRWSKVNIVEDNAVRKVVHWHYVLCNPDYKVPYDTIGTQLPEVDEFWTFYPDGSGTRYIRYTPKLDMNIKPNQSHEIAELIAVSGSSTDCVEHFDSQALTFTNLEGKTILCHPGSKFDYNSEINDWPQQISVVHFKNQPDFYSVFSADERFPDTYSAYKIEYQNTWHNTNQRFVHWPVNKRPYVGYNGSSGTWKAEVSHSCLTSIDVRDGVDWSDNYKTDSRGRKYRDWVMLFGVEQKNKINTIREIVSSWLPSFEIKMLSNNCKFEEADHREKALVFNLRTAAKECSFELTLKGDSAVLINPVIKIRNWNSSTLKGISINNNELSTNDYKTAMLDNKDCLIWIGKTLDDKSRIQINR
jgi:hypothetical protein